MMEKIYQFFGGKSVFFAFWFFSFGVVLAFVGKINADYVALAAAIQTLIATRSICDDWHERGMTKLHNGNGGGDGNGHDNGNGNGHDDDGSHQ